MPLLPPAAKAGNAHMRGHHSPPPAAAPPAAAGACVRCHAPTCGAPGLAALNDPRLAGAAGGCAAVQLARSAETQDCMACFRMAVRTTDFHHAGAGPCAFSPCVNLLAIHTSLHALADPMRAPGEVARSRQAATGSGLSGAATRPDAQPKAWLAALGLHPGAGLPLTFPCSFCGFPPGAPPSGIFEMFLRELQQKTLLTCLQPKP